MSIGFLRRQSNYPGGISAGGGDTGFETQPQKTVLLKKVSQAALDFVLPKGTVILSTIVMPDPDAPAAAGTVSLVSLDGSGDDDVTFADDVAATGYSETLAATTTVDGDEAINGVVATGTILAADTRFRVTPDSIGAGTAALVGFEAILPRMRA
jgi:hypothetical protein